MRYWLLLAALVVLLPLTSACGSCTPQAAYWQPAYTTPGHYQYDSYFAGYRRHYYKEWYQNSYGEERYRWNYDLIPIYKTQKSWIDPVYHPRRYVPAVVCATSG